MNDPLSLVEAEQALQFLSANCSREEWFRMAACLKDEYGDSGWELFERWSQSGGSYDARACKDTWRSAKAGHVRIGTLIKLATDAGWVRERRELSAEDKKRLEVERKKAAAERAKRQAEEEALVAKVQDAVAVLCASFWDSCTTDNDLSQHPYLVRKRVSGKGCRLAAASCYFAINVNRGEAVQVASPSGTKAEREAAGIHLFRIKKGDLLMPLCDAAGYVWSLQRIDADGTKMFPKGARKRGCGLLLGEASADQPLGFAEGYATGATVHELMGWPVLVCVDSGNLLPAATNFDNLPHKLRVWLADRDKPDKGGTQAGIKAALACREALGGLVAMPAFPAVAVEAEQQEQDAAA